jgi:hypothetical protein
MQQKPDKKAIITGTSVEHSSIPVSSTYNDEKERFRVVVAAGYLKGVCVFDRNRELIWFSERTD